MTDGDQSLGGLIWAVLLTVLNGAIGLVLASWRREMNEVKKTAERAKDDLASHKLFAAENFATKNEVERLGDRIEERFDKMDAKLDKLDDKLPGRSKPN